MYSCFDISKEFLSLAKEEGYSLEPMKLLKLTYIAHGYHLGFYSKPLFYNQVQAWKFGPVIPELYHTIKRFGSGSVTPNIIDLYADKKLSVEDKKFVKIIWNAYKKLDGLQLSSKTHEDGTPWAKVYDPNVYHKVIENHVIEEYYKKFINERRTATSR